MKKIVLVMLLLVSMSVAAVAGGGHYTQVTQDIEALETQVNTLEIEVANNDNEIYSLLSKQKVSSSALSSVELNPDHDGLSVGVGASAYAGQGAYAVGIMYGIGGLGLNVKGYQAQSGYGGVSVGATYGF